MNVFPVRLITFFSKTRCLAETCRTNKADEENEDIATGSRVPNVAASGSSSMRWWHQSKLQRCGGLLALCLIVVEITIGVAVGVGGSGESVDRDEQIMSPTLSSSLSLVPSTAPSTAPSTSPSTAPSMAPSTAPSMAPSTAPTATPTAVPTATPTAAFACYTNLTVLFVDQLDGDPLVQTTYTLCPNTVFEVGFSDSNGNCCFDGQVFLTARKNTRFQCGQNGDIDNNCPASGGETHVVFFNEILDEVSTVNNNAEFAGITLENAALVTLFLGSSGDITFQDCIFRVRRQSCPCLLGLVVCLFADSTRFLLLTPASSFFTESH
jgi:hypothetical protein